MPRIIDIYFRASTAQARTALMELGATADRTAMQVERGFMRSQRALGAVSTALDRTGRMMTGIGVGMLGAGYYSAKAAVNFQKSMELIHTQAGASQAEVNQLSAAILKMAQSGKYAQTPQQMADALFHLESIGMRLNKGVLPNLKTALDTAAVGNVNAEAAATALGAAWAATGRKGGDAFRQLAGIINATVGVGNMRMAQLVQAMGRGVIPAFIAVGLKAKDAMGAIALLTDAGYTASSSAAQLATALHFLEQPTAKADKYLAAIGMTQFQMAADLHQPRGLLAALRDLYDHLARLPQGVAGLDAGQVLSALFPGGRGRIMLSLIQNLGTYQNKLNQIDRQQRTFNEAIAATHRTMAFQLHAAWAQIQADLIKFGDVLLPIVAKYLPMFTSALQSVFGWLTKLPRPLIDFAAKAAVFLTIAGPLVMLAGKVINLWKAFRELAFWMGIIRTESGALGAGGAAGGLAAGGAAGGLAGALGRGAASGSLRLGGMLEALGLGGLGMKVVGAGAAAESILPMLLRGGFAVGAGAMAAGLLRSMTGIGKSHGKSSNLGSLIGTGAGAVLGGVLGSVLPGPGTVVGAGIGAGLGNLAGGFFGSLHGGGVIRRFQMGGYLSQDNVPALLQLGEGVLNRTAMASLGVGGLNALNAGQGFGGNINIQPSPAYFVVDGRVLARSVLQYTLRTAARGPSSLVGGALVSGVASPVSVSPQG